MEKTLRYIKTLIETGSFDANEVMERINQVLEVKPDCITCCYYNFCYQRANPCRGFAQYPRCNNYIKSPSSITQGARVGGDKD